MSDLAAEKPQNKDKIAMIVIVFVLASIALITLFALYADMQLPDGQKAAAVKDTLGTVLPLWGTWIGTVLAYYFSKENFDAASKSVQNMVAVVTADQKLKSISATDKNVMMPASDIVSYKYTTVDEINAVTLSSLIKFISEKNINRLLFINNEGILKFCIHRSIIDKFISTLVATKEDISIPNLKFTDLLNTDIDEIKRYVLNGAGFIKQQSTLLDVKQLMDQNKFCADVFLTATGSPDEPIIGWITDSKLLEKSQV